MSPPSFAEIVTDAPVLVELDVYYSSPWSTADYKSFMLRAPRLKVLRWRNQFAERVAIDVGRPGSVKVGVIQLRSPIYYSRKMEDYEEQMMRMLEGLLPDRPRERSSVSQGQGAAPKRFRTAFLHCLRIILMR
jgi:hypothetical protein